MCRICGNTELVPVLNLGEQALTGVFPRSLTEVVPAGPLTLVKCHGRETACGLLQLQHTYDLTALYGDNYGYRSGLNATMVEHLHSSVQGILARFGPQPGSLVIDIGSNDATTLKAYPQEGFTLVGVDPTGNKFRGFYPPHIRLMPDFFSAAGIRKELGDRKAAVITSFSMFYDLERPLEFMEDVANTLTDDGVWVFEQSYMPTMLARNSYDTVCHEHLEYYGLTQVKWMTERTGLRIIDVGFNDVNGGSFSVVATLQRSRHRPTDRVAEALRAEATLGMETLEPYRHFVERVSRTRDDLRRFLERAKQDGQTVAALGASTKGNVILQFCELTTADIARIGEVNDDKFGRYTPGTGIPIVPEADVLEQKPDYLLVLPWHFRRYFESSERFAGQRLVCPLPEVDITQL